MQKKFLDTGVTLSSQIQNNIPVYYFQKSGAPLTIYVVFDFGSIHATLPGAAHFLEHMLVAGTQKWPSKKLLAEHTRKMGWRSNAFTWKHRMVFPLWCNDLSDLVPAFECFSEIFHKSLFNESVIEHERNAIFDEIRRRDVEAGRFALNERFKNLYPHDPLEKIVLGTADELKKITKQDLLENWKKLFAAKKSIVAVGDAPFEMLLEASQNFTRSFSGDASLPTIPFTNISIFEKRYIDIPFSQGQVDICFNLQKEEDSKEREASLSFLQYILFSQDGLIIRKLRFEKGLTYAVSSLYDDSLYFGTYGASVTCAAENQEQVVAELISLFEKEMYSEITKERIQDFLSERQKRRRRVWEMGEDWVEAYYMDLLERGDKTLFFDDIEKILSTLSIEEIHAHIKKVCAATRRSILVYKPKVK